MPKVAPSELVHGLRAKGWKNIANHVKLVGDNKERSGRNMTLLKRMRKVAAFEYKKSPLYPTKEDFYLRKAILIEEIMANSVDHMLKAQEKANTNELVSGVQQEINWDKLYEDQHDFVREYLKAPDKEALLHQIDLVRNFAYAPKKTIIEEREKHPHIIEGLRDHMRQSQRRGASIEGIFNSELNRILNQRATPKAKAKKICLLASVLVDLRNKHGAEWALEYKSIMIDLYQTQLRRHPSIVRQICELQ